MTHDLSPHLPTSSTSPLAPSGEGIPIAWVEDLFGRLHACVGSALFTVVYAGAAPELVKQEWAEGLVGFSADEIRRGLAAVRTRKFAPNLPEFLHLCRPALDPETAWIEAELGMRRHAERVAFEWSHPAVFWAAREMQFELRSSTFAACRKRWEAALSATWSVRTWPPIPDPTVQAIEHNPTPSAANPARLYSALAGLQEQRRKLTGFATKAQQDAVAAEVQRRLRAEQQAAQQAPDTGFAA